MSNEKSVQQYQECLVTPAAPNALIHLSSLWSEHLMVSYEAPRNPNAPWILCPTKLRWVQCHLGGVQCHLDGVQYH